MSHNISQENLSKLFVAVEGDLELVEFIQEQLNSFVAYHQAIFEMETWRELYNHKNLSQEDYQDKFSALDKKRTSCHDVVLGAVAILNRMAAQFGISNIYDGEISKEPLPRRIVADAVLGYVENIINNRQ